MYVEEVDPSVFLDISVTPFLPEPPYAICTPTPRWPSPHGYILIGSEFQHAYAIASELGRIITTPSCFTFELGVLGGNPDASYSSICICRSWISYTGVWGREVAAAVSAQSAIATVAFSAATIASGSNYRRECY